MLRSPVETVWVVNIEANASHVIRRDGKRALPVLLFAAQNGGVEGMEGQGDSVAVGEQGDLNIRVVSARGKPPRLGKAYAVQLSHWNAQEASVGHDKGEVLRIGANFLEEDKVSIAEADLFRAGGKGEGWAVFVREISVPGAELKGVELM